MTQTRASVAHNPLSVSRELPWIADTDARHRHPEVGGPLHPRFVDDPDTPDSGNGDPPVVDMGAYEFQGLPCPWDLDGDGNVGITDLLMLLEDFGSCDGSPADFDGDGCVGIVDLLTLIGNFGPCSIECLSHAGCDDDNPCTIDLCIGGKCFHVPIGGPNCGG